MSAPPLFQVERVELARPVGPSLSSARPMPVTSRREPVFLPHSYMRALPLTDECTHLSKPNTTTTTTRIVNVMRASGCSVPDWMVALPNPSQNSKKQLKQRPIGRKDISRTLGAGALDDADEGARKGTGAGQKRGGGGGKDGEHKGVGQGPKHKKQRIMSGVGSGFAGASAGGGGKATEQDAGAAKGTRKAVSGQKKPSKAEGKASASERPAAAKKAKREVALDE